MVANGSATGLRTLVGNDEQDWTDYVEKLDLGYSHRDRSGIFFIEGSLVLVDAIGVPESLDARKNPSRWPRGQLIKVMINNGRGWELHPLGWVYILKEPLPGHPDNPKITIKLGCILTLKDYKQPDDDKSGVELGKVTQRGTIIQNILNAAGIPFNQTLNDYPLDVPLQKQDVSSYVQQAGELAYSAMQALYQDNQGVVRLRSLSSALQPPLFTLSVGGVYSSNAIALAIEATEEVAYEPLEGAETPADKVKATGNKKSSKQLQGSTTTIYREYAPSQVVGTPGEDIILVRQVVTTDTSSRLNRTVREISSTLKGLISPDLYGGDKSFVVESISVDSYQFEGVEAAKLVYRQRRISRYLVQVAPDYYTAANPTNITDDNPLKDSFGQVESTVYGYQYDDKELLIKTTERKSEAIAAIIQDETASYNSAQANLFSNPYEPVLSETKEVSYTNLGEENYWKQSTIERKCVARAYPSLEYKNTDLDSSNIGQASEIFESDRARRIRAKKTLVSVNDETVISNAGQNNPPSAERAPQSQAEEEKPIEGVAEFKTPGTEEQERERTIQVPYAVSAQQLSMIAQTEGALLIGKRLGQRIQLPLPNAFIDNPYPIPQFVSIEPDGTTLQFIADAIEYSHTVNSCIVSIDGIWIATLPGQAKIPVPYEIAQLQPPYVGVSVSAGDVAIAPPAEITTTITGGMVHGGTIEHIPYDLGTLPDIVITGGIVHGGSIARTQELQGPGITTQLISGAGITTFELGVSGSSAITKAITGNGEIIFALNINGNSAITKAIAGNGQAFYDRVLNGSGAITKAIAGNGQTSISYILQGASAVTQAIAGSGEIVIVAVSLNGAGVLVPAIAGAGAGVAAINFNLNGSGARAMAIAGNGQTSAPFVSVYSSDGDENDILNFIGKNYDTGGTWTNPHTAGRVIVAYSSGSFSPTILVDRQANPVCYTNSVANSWFGVGFGPGKTVTPNYYSIRHDGETGYYLRSWKLQGSNDSVATLAAVTNWNDLDTRTNDATINAPNAWGSWMVPGLTGGYEWLRVVQTAVNSSGSDYLLFGEFQVYGTLTY